MTSRVRSFNVRSIFRSDRLAEADGVAIAVLDGELVHTVLVNLRPPLDFNPG